MKYLYALAFGVTTLTAPAFAGGSRKPASEQRCPGYDSEDPWAIDGRFSAGPNKGRCMDLTEMRPIHVLTAEESASFSPKPGETLIANFRHEGRYWIARIPKDPVDEVYFQTERFDPPGSPLAAKLNEAIWFSAHGQIRFKLKKPITIYPQNRRDGELPAEELTDLIVSSEAVTMPGDPFDLVKGMQDRFAIAKRFTSLQDKVKFMIIDQGHAVRQHRITASPDRVEARQRNQLFLYTAIRRSERDYQSFQRGETVLYSTFQRSCITEAFEVFDDAGNYGLLGTATDLFKRNPSWIPWYLEQRGLISSKDSPVPSLNEEFGLN